MPQTFTLKPGPGLDLATVPGWERTDSKKAASAPAKPSAPSLPSTWRTPVEQLTPDQIKAELAAWDALGPSVTISPQVQERQPKPPTRKAAGCGEQDTHPMPLRSSEIGSRDRQAEMLAKATIASELGLLIEVRWWSAYDPPRRPDGKSVQGFQCVCEPATLWARAGRGDFWDVVSTLLHEGKHSEQYNRLGPIMTDAELSRREADADRWAAEQVSWLQAEGF